MRLPRISGGSRRPGGRPRIARTRRCPPVDRQLQPAPPRRGGRAGAISMGLLTRALGCALLVGMTVGVPSAQQGAGGGAQAAADEWAQFRGNRRLTGVAPAGAAAVPATPKVLWTWDAGDAIESSAAISGDLVFIGAATGELV